MKLPTMFFLLMPVLAFLNACSTVQSIAAAPQPSWPWLKADDPNMSLAEIIQTFCSGKDANDKVTCTDNDALVAFYNASRYCRGVQNYYESGGKRAFATKTGIGLIGTFSSIVMAPLSTGSAATAWTGISGVANAAQTALEDEFEKTIIAKRRAFIDKAAEEGEQKFLELSQNTNKQTPPAILIATAIQTARSCSTASAKADDSVLQALAVNTSSKNGTSNTGGQANAGSEQKADTAQKPQEPQQ